MIHVVLNHGLTGHGTDEGPLPLEAAVRRRDGYDPV